MGFSPFGEVIEAQTMQSIGLGVAALLTCAVLSYILGENPFSRLAQYLFVGVAAGYAAALAWNHVIAPRLVKPFQSPGEIWPYALYILLGALLLTRLWRPLAALGSIPLAILVGTGAALALGGILTGTLIPQVAASLQSIAPAHYGGGIRGWAHALDAAFLLLATLAVLASFQHHRTGTGLGRFLYGGTYALGRLGRIVIMVAFGTVLAGAALSFFTLLQSRLAFLVEWLGSLFAIGR